MESGRFLPVNEVNGINLDNYFPYQNSYNTVLYLHKRFRTKSQGDLEIGGYKSAVKKKKELNKKKTKEDKAVTCDIKDTKSQKEGTRNDSVLQQTIRFAKNLVPIALPPNEGSDTPVFYTIKTCNKCKKKDQSFQEVKPDKRDDATFEKKRSKKLIETFKKERKHPKNSYSRSYSGTHSSESNTLDDLNMNQSLCNLSDSSDKKENNQKQVICSKRKTCNSDKIGVSESFECLATKLNDASETKIKIHLMNDKEKHFLSESIRIPVLDAVKDCLNSLNNSDVREEVRSVQRLVKYNSQKLDAIFDKLTSIEKHLADTNDRVVIPRKAVKVSRLEQLAEDRTDIVRKEYSSEDELPNLDSNIQRNEVTVLHGENLGCGEISGKVASTSVGVRTDQHRIPARFCWTDAKRSN